MREPERTRFATSDGKHDHRDTQSHNILTSEAIHSTFIISALAFCQMNAGCRRLFRAAAARPAASKACIVNGKKEIS